MHNSPGNCARELFKPSKDLASLWVYNEKKILCFSFFVSDITSGLFLIILAQVTWPWAQTARWHGSISLKFLLEARMWVFWAFLWQKYQSGLTLWEPAYMTYSNFDFGLKNSSFRLPYQCPSSSVDCARELFNGSNGSASLIDSTRKTFFLVGGFGFFVTDVISEVVLGSF